MQFPFLAGERIKVYPKHLMLGMKGEQIAAEYLRSLGYSIREKNVHMGQDELDIIAWDPEDQVLVFVEVKTRSKKTRDGYHPEMTANARKRHALKRAARRWVANHNFDGGYRIDLLCVEEGYVAHHFKELSW